jgi:phage shock protein A
MSSVVEVTSRLDQMADELDKLSKELGQTERQLGPIEASYEKFLDTYETGLWDKHVAGDKLPPEGLRVRLAHRAIDAQLLGEYSELIRKRKRLEKRIKALGAAIDAQRSILSALKQEMMAVEGR